MRDAHLYLSMVLGLVVFLTVALVTVLYRRTIKSSFNGRPRRVPSLETFFCVRSSLKQISDEFYVGQILFSNQRDSSLTTQDQVHRQANED